MTLPVSTGAGRRKAGGREFHMAGAEWKKDRLTMAALTTEGRFKVMVLLERVL